MIAAIVLHMVAARSWPPAARAATPSTFCLDTLPSIRRCNRKSLALQVPLGRRHQWWNGVFTKVQCCCRRILPSDRNHGARTAPHSARCGHAVDRPTPLLPAWVLSPLAAALQLLLPTMAAPSRLPTPLGCARQGGGGGDNSMGGHWGCTSPLPHRAA